jgi:hypothetical protein
MNCASIYLRGSIAVCLGITAGPSMASVRALMPAHVLTNQADVIVVATVLGITSTQAVPVWGFRVEAVLKGAVRPGDTVTATWPSPGLQDSRHLASSSPLRGLFFLKDAGAGGLQIIPVTSGGDDVSNAFFLRSVGLVTYSSADTVLDKTFRELALAGTQGDSTALSSLLGTVREAKSRPPATRDVCLQLAAAPLTAANTVGTKCLLTLGDVQALSSVTANQDVLFQSDAGVSVSRFVGEDFTNTDPSAITMLGDMIRTSRHPELQQAAARALARMHTRPSLPYLAGILTSSDVKLVTFAVGGLSMFANNVPIGTNETVPGPYRTAETIAHSTMDERLVQAKPSYYVAFWQQWWQQNQKQLTN